jgi:hypothetical protein
MRKRLMKSVLVGTLVFAASAIVASPAFGGSLSQSFPRQQGYQPASSVPGSDEFPNLTRLSGILIPAERRQLDAVGAAAHSVQEQQSSALQRVHQPGVTSGYAALPPEVMTTPKQHTTLTPTDRRQLDAAVARSNSKASFVPGFRDVPNTRPVHSTSGGSSSIDSSFNWSDAGVGIGIGFAIAGGLVLVALAGIRRNKAMPVQA